MITRRRLIAGGVAGATSTGFSSTTCMNGVAMTFKPSTF